jgi:cytidylate kinase
VGLAVPLDRDQVEALRSGVELEEGLARVGLLRAATGAEIDRLERLAGRSRGRLTWYRAVLTQGWKRQLRRMFASVGAPVERLVRVRIGSLRLDDLRSGEVRPLSAAERDRLGGAPPPRAARRKLVVSIDGPGSSGKSSIGAAAAAEVGYRFCDTGVLYRGLAWLADAAGVGPEDQEALVALIGRMELVEGEGGRYDRIRADGRDVTPELHSAAVDRLVSAVAADPGVRAALLPPQRRLAERGGIVMAGRDIGSVVLPDADLRLYLDVSLEERAERRAQQRELAPGSPEARAILDDLRRRDAIDSGRSAAPLRVPEGAVVIRGDGRTFDQTLELVVEAIRRAERGAGLA